MGREKKDTRGTLSSLFRNAGQTAQLEARHAADEAALASSQADPTFDVPNPAKRPAHVNSFSILEYIEAPWGLGIKLFPVQRWIVKLYYNLPLDTVTKTITVTNMLKTKVLHTFTEAEFLRYMYNEGCCNIKELDHDRRELILSIGRRAGKCVKQGTLVLTDRGMVPIETLGQAPEEGFAPVDVGVAQEGGRRARAEAFYNGGVKPTFAVKTDAGYGICGTSNHRIKVLTAAGQVQWRYLDEIRPGDYLAVNRTTDLWPNTPLDVRPYHDASGHKPVALPEVLDEKLGNLLGYLVGDGSWTNPTAVALTVEHDETKAHLTQLLTDLLGVPREQPDMRTLATGRLEFCSTSARRFLDALGFRLDAGRYNKEVPWSILQSPRPVVCAFLRGLFETDGCAEGGGRNITFCSASLKLAEQVQLLLLNLGIVSTLRSKWNKKMQRAYATLLLKGVRSRQRFAACVGFDSNKKQQPLLAALTEAQEGKSDTESLPHQLGPLQDLLATVPKRNARRGEPGWGRSTLREAMGNAIKPGCDEDLTYPRLQRVLSVGRELGAGAKELAHFEELLRTDYFFDPVVSVEQGEHPVYDLTVPDGESFVAGGLTNHNTTLAGIFASYEIYRLLCMGNPQKYYGLPPNNRIQIISVATDKDQAGILFNEVSGHLNKCEYFKQYIASNTQTHINFRTPADIERNGHSTRAAEGKFVSHNGRASLRITFKSSIAKGLRGFGNAVIIMDEMAHFLDKGQGGAKEIYDSITPSAAAFAPKDPDNTLDPIGPVEARIILISSPLAKSGQFFDIFNNAMTGGDGSKNRLAIKAPTWLVNPTITPDYYAEKYAADPAVFMVEHGAEFSDSLRGWIDRPEDLYACIDPEHHPREVGIPRYPYFMGIDVGLVGDATALCIGHVDGDQVVLDYHEKWKAGEKWEVSNPHLLSPSTEYATGLDRVVRLDFDEIADWIASMTKRFYIAQGIFDRWNGLPLEQALHKRGLTQFTSEFFTRDQTSKMFQASKSFILDKQVKLYDWPRGDGDGRAAHSPLIRELLDLQAEVISKHLVVVAKSKVAGSTDDVSDAFIRMVWLANEARLNRKHVAGSGQRPPGTDRPARVASATHYQAARMRQHGVFTERLSPHSGLGKRLSRMSRRG